MNHNYFGQLEYSEKLNWYSTEFEVAGNAISLSISAKDESADFDCAETLIASLLRDVGQVHDYITSEMYDLYRKEWSGLIFKTPKTKFQRKINLSSIVIFVTNDLDMYFDDGGLFKSHDVVVRYSINERFHNCRLAG